MPSSTSAAPAPHLSAGLTTQAVHTRTLSLDVFRGLTMALMIFVNDLDDVSGISRWLHHIPRDIDAMSPVDAVFPFFLFAVGLSLPLAVRQRLARHPAQPRLWFHIATRAAALVLLGLILANAPSADPQRTHLRGSVWALISLLGAILWFAVYPSARSPKVTARISPRLARTLQATGVLLVAAMLAIFRRTTPAGHTAWLDFSYPEILGLIGLTYLALCLLYLPTRRLAGGPAAAFLLLIAFNIACAAHRLTWPHPLYLFPFGNGAMTAIAMAGVFVSTLLLPAATDKAPTAPRLSLAIAFAVLCAAAGLLTRPLGISKIRATPTWTLWSIAAATILFTLLFWLCDLRGIRRWATPFLAPGRNTLLTYLLPDLVYFGLAATGTAPLLEHWHTGAPGILRAGLFTAAMLGLSWVLTRARLRLQL